MSRERDEEWSAEQGEHPRAESELTDLQRLRELYRAFAAPEADEAVWDAALARVRQALDRAASERRVSRRPLWVLVGLSAAAALVGLLLARSLWTAHPVDSTPPQAVVEPFPVAESDDVRIVSMDARDAAFLVVGELPVDDRMQFAQPEDIRVIRCERCPYSGRMARLDREGEVPMFVSAALEVPNDD